MREIKFRAWDKETNDMIYDNLVFEMRSLGYYDDSKNHKSCEQKCENPCKENNHFIGYMSECPAFIIMQYTGLLDKNGVDVYEGDIVPTAWGIGRVAWSNDFAGFHIKSGSCYISLRDALPIEVAGNVYENPEMLEAKS